MCKLAETINNVTTQRTSLEEGLGSTRRGIVRVRGRIKVSVRVWVGVGVSVRVRVRVRVRFRIRNRIGVGSSNRCISVFTLVFKIRVRG